MCTSRAISQDFPRLGAMSGRPEWDRCPRVAWAAAETGLGMCARSLVLKKIQRNEVCVVF